MRRPPPAGPRAAARGPAAESAPIVATAPRRRPRRPQCRPRPAITPKRHRSGVRSTRRCVPPLLPRAAAVYRTIARRMTAHNAATRAAAPLLPRVQCQNRKRWRIPEVVRVFFRLRQYDPVVELRVLTMCKAFARSASVGLWEALDRIEATKEAAVCAVLLALDRRGRLPRRLSAVKKRVLRVKSGRADAGTLQFILDHAAPKLEAALLSKMRQSVPEEEDVDVLSEEDEAGGGEEHVAGLAAPGSETATPPSRSPTAASPPAAAASAAAAAVVTRNGAASAAPRAQPVVKDQEAPLPWAREALLAEWPLPAALSLSLALALPTARAGAAAARWDEALRHTAPNVPIAKLQAYQQRLGCSPLPALAPALRSLRSAIAQREQSEDGSGAGAGVVAAAHEALTALEAVPEGPRAGTAHPLPAVSAFRACLHWRQQVGAGAGRDCGASVQLRWRLGGEGPFLLGPSTRAYPSDAEPAAEDQALRAVAVGASGAPRTVRPRGSPAAALAGAARAVREAAPRPTLALLVDASGPRALLESYAAIAAEEGMGTGAGCGGAEAAYAAAAIVTDAGPDCVIFIAAGSADGAALVAAPLTAGNPSARVCALCPAPEGNE